MTKLQPDIIELDIMTSHGISKATLAQWIQKGPGERYLSRPIAARNILTGEKLSTRIIPFIYRNTIVSRCMIRFRMVKNPWEKE